VPPLAVAPRPEAQRQPKPKQVELSVIIAEVPRGRFLKEAEHAKVLKPAAQQRLVERILTLRDKGKAKVIAEPRMTTPSGRPAGFFNGGEMAIQKQDGVAQASIRFEEFGTRVSMTPTFLKNGKLQLEIEPEVSRLDPEAGSTINGVAVPGRTTMRMHLAVEMKDGQSVILGGMPATQGGEKQNKRRETIILVTPRVVRPKKKAAAAESPE
jgi:pilus assembly protein CpaC